VSDLFPEPDEDDPIGADDDEDDELELDDDDDAADLGE